MADHIGQQLGKYRLTHLLGAGGFAEVYLGVHVHLGTEAAIKLLHTQLAAEADMEKFRQEARTIGGLVHPNIVRVLDFDVQDTMPYLVMDYAPNGSLRQRLPPGKPLAPADLLPYLTQMAEALHYAHERKLVHRDIKPENMLLGRQGEVLLSDFGIALVAQSTTSQKTEGVAGTAAYMAPEQIQGKPRPASDLYSLGVVVYEWLTGERPFQGTFTEVASQQLFAVPPPLCEKLPGLSPLIEQVVLTALAKDPKSRFGSVRAFATAFAQASGTGPAVSMLSTQIGLPGTPVSGVEQGRQPGVIRTVGSQITPRVTPQVAMVSVQGVPGSVPGNAGAATQPGVFAAPQPTGMPLGPEVLYSPTQLIAPTRMTSLPLGGSRPSPVLAPVSGSGPYVAAPAGGSNAYAAPTNTGTGAMLANMPGSATYLPPGWAVAPSTLGSSPANAAPPAPPGGLPGGKPRKGLRVAWIALAAVLALVLIGGAAAVGLPLLGHAGSPGSSGPTAATAATVTITPKSSDLKKSYTLTAVMGTPDAANMQVQARTVSTTTQVYQQTVNATGSKTTPGTHASGTLVVYNFDTANPVSLPTGSTFPNTGGCTPNSLVVVLDAPVSLVSAPPGGGAPGYYTTITVQAHIQQVGSGGNFPAQPTSSNLLGSYATPLSGSCASFGYYKGACQYPRTPCLEIISQSAFSGGTDAQTSTVVAQSDIDNAANTLIQANQPDAQQVVQGALQPNEQLVGTAQCQPNESANQQAGDVATTVTVSVSFTCTGEAYDHDGALQLANKMLLNEAASNPGGAYVLAGQVKTTLVSATLDNQGTIALVVQAEGIWEYQFTTSQKQALAQLIVGKSAQDAKTLLETQTGVEQATIQLPSAMGKTLPSSSRNIMVHIQAVAGL